ncbi:MAG: MmcB family DNA repair protein [Parvularculaceae bacterium]|nr:MmcB family DNA repair protein [Parvularculaceae bacterium]
MENQSQSLSLALEPDVVARPDVTSTLTRGVSRLFASLGLASLAEFRLPNGRRADLAGLCGRGRLVIAEIKSCPADFTADQKWSGYVQFCDEFYFAVADGFPCDLLPSEEGLIMADGFGGAVVRRPCIRKLAPARRKAMTLRFARQAAFRNERFSRRQINER